MLQARNERLLMNLGILLCLAGGLAAAAGAWSVYRTREFQATAIRTSATVIRAGPPRGLVRFMAEHNSVVEASLPQGHNEPVGTTLKILYEPGNPNHWKLEPGYDPASGIGLAAGGAAVLAAGAALVTVASVSKRRKSAAVTP